MSRFILTLHVSHKCRTESHQVREDDRRAHHASNSGVPVFYSTILWEPEISEVNFSHDVDIDRFIRFSQGTRLLNNLFSSKTDTIVQGYNDVFDQLLEEFRNTAARDTLVVAHDTSVVVHRIWEDLVPKVDDLRESFSKYPLSNVPEI